MQKSGGDRTKQSTYGEGIRNPRAKQRAFCIASSAFEPDLAELREGAARQRNVVVHLDADQDAPRVLLVQPDGGDIEFVSFDAAEGTASLRLLLEGANCAECVLPRRLLEGVALQMMQPFVPGLTAVAIDDPRES